MILKDIIAISGEQGLFRFIAQSKNSMVVEHLETGKRKSAFTTAKVSSLEDISVFTDDEDLPLSKVLDRIYDRESGGQSIDPKAGQEPLKNYFAEIVPEYSRERVYASDIKKIIQWYNLLQSRNMLIREDPEKTDDKTGVETEEPKKEEVPAQRKKKKNNPEGSQV